MRWGRKLGVSPDKVFVNVERYGNMSAATVLVALVEAIEQGNVQAHSKILLPAFGAGLTWNSHLVQWGDRITPLATSDIELPPSDETALELIAPYLAQQRRQSKSQTESLRQAGVT